MIPQADDGGRSFPPVAACATALPSYVQGPLLYAWLSKENPLPGSTPVFTDDRQARHIVSTFARTLPIPFTILLQNVLDPAHVRDYSTFKFISKISRRQRVLNPFIYVLDLKRFISLIMDK